MFAVKERCIGLASRLFCLDLSDDYPVVMMCCIRGIKTFGDESAGPRY